MIIVVEGISAAGKTTWCRQQAGLACLPESFPSDRHLQPVTGAAAAIYWTNWNAKRWSDALALEAAHGDVVCDTDPLKLRYLWTLMRIGEASEADWQIQRDVAQQAVAARRLGFADLYLVKEIDPAQARRQRDQDPARTRSRFDLHVLLQEPLLAWYRALGTVLPGQVRWVLPPHLPIEANLTRTKDRYDLRKFDAFIDALSAV